MAIVLPKFSRRRASPGLVVETQPAVNVTLCHEDGLYCAGGNSLPDGGSVACPSMKCREWKFPSSGTTR